MGKLEVSRIERERIEFHKGKRLTPSFEVEPDEIDD